MLLPVSPIGPYRIANRSLVHTLNSQSMSSIPSHISSRISLVSNVQCRLVPAVESIKLVQFSENSEGLILGFSRGRLLTYRRKLA